MNKAIFLDILKSLPQIFVDVLLIKASSIFLLFLDYLFINKYIKFNNLVFFHE